MPNPQNPIVPPRMSTAARDALSSPEQGWIIENTDDDELQRYSGTVWAAIGAAVGMGTPTLSGVRERGIPGVGGITSFGSGGGTTANTVVYMPFFITTPITLDSCQYSIANVAGGTTKLRWGLYAADSTWHPTGAALFDFEDSYAIGTGSGSHTHSLAVDLAPGGYLTTFNTDRSQGAFFGFANLAWPWVQLSPAKFFTWYTATQTYPTTGFPGTPTDWTTSLYQANTSRIHWLLYEWHDT